LWFTVISDLDVDIPPRSIVGILSTDREDSIHIGYPVLNGDKLVMVTGDQTILPRGTGEATMDWPWWITFDSADGTLTRGERWGAEADNFKLKKNKQGFLAIPMKDGGDPPAEDAGYFGLEYCR
jgi:hypothetical protein